MEENMQESVISPATPGTGKSKLDTLSKDDLIKYAKKQMALLQKVKSKCSDLEKEVETLRENPSGVTGDCVIQELTERMDAILLEKAEIQQNLVLLRKENEMVKEREQHALEKLKSFQELLDHANRDHVRKTEDLQKAMDASNVKHKEEVEALQRQNEKRAKEQSEELKKLQIVNMEKNAEMERLKEDHRVMLSESHRELEVLQEETKTMKMAHEQEVREMTEQLELTVADFEMEKERLLLLQDELTEQLALKETFLHDVQEEEEEPSRTRDCSGYSEISAASASDDMQDEVVRLRLTFEDLQSQNTMLQEELTYLSNVKTELESQIHQMKDEFQHEREDLEFKINELQMCKEDERMVRNGSEENLETVQSQHVQELETLKEIHKNDMADLKKFLSEVEKEKEKSNHELQELRNRCEQLLLERNSAIEEYEKTKDILRNLELELGDRTGNFIKQYNAMKEQGASAIDQLQQKLRSAYKEKDLLQEQLNTLTLTLESCKEEAKAAEDLRVSLANLQQNNKDILSILHQKEGTIMELEETLDVLSNAKKDIHAEMERVKNEYDIEHAKAVELEMSLYNLSLCSKDMHQKCEELTTTLTCTQAEKESMGHELGTLQGELAQAILEKDQRTSDLQVLAKELARLKESESALQETSKAQCVNATAYDEERRVLEEQLHILSEERDTLKREVEAKQVQISRAWSHILALLDQSNEEVVKRAAEDIPTLVDSVLAQVKHDLLQQSSERVAQLVQEAENMREESMQREAEFQACLEDLNREKSLLKTSLDEQIADTEALNRDLSDMKAVNMKGKAENQELLAQLADVAEKLQGMENESGKTEKPFDESACEKEDMQRLLAEKESLLLHLQKEITFLKESQKDSDQSEDNMVTELSAKIADLQKENTEKEEKMNKIKAVAVKARKELDSSRKEVFNLREEVENLKEERDRMSNSVKDVLQGAEGYKNLLVEYDRQTEELEQTKEKVEETERQIGDLNKRLQATLLQHEQSTSEREDMMAHLETLQSNVKQLEAQALEMHKLKCNLEKDLKAERLLREQKEKEQSAIVKEAEDLTAQLQRQKQQLQQAAQEVEQLRKDAQQSTLMDMEMAHYERLVKELNQKLVEKDSHIQELSDEIQSRRKAEDGLAEEIVSLKLRVERGEEKTSKMKQLLVKTKKELSDAKKHEVDQMFVQASLKGELEAHQQQLEDYKIQCSSLTAEKHRLQEQLRTVTEQQQRTASTFQHRLSTLQEECSTTKAELSTMTSEFESYKVRVHNVLKQQKNRNSTKNESEVAKQEREYMESMLEQLQLRLQDTQQNLQQSCCDLQQLQAEHDTLLERHNKILQEGVAKEAELRERLLSLQSEHMTLKTEHTQTVSQLSAQADSMRSTFREQVRHLQEEHRSTVETLQQQISRLESQLFQQQQREPGITSPVSVPQARKVLQERKAVDLSLLDLQSMAREEGEGMETTETESASSTSTPLLSLDQLLTSPDPKQEPFIWLAEVSKEELTQKLNTATRSLEHVNGLLHETEATNAVLMEQIALLKNEVRRLERNQEREKSVASLEYLKNVLLQFIFLKPGSERQALLPVIHTMLQLSPEEKSRLGAIALGDQESAAGSRASGWTSYLHSWSGIR
ncbi:GRIP and coiled-coil domain-containing protein 2 isoform X2 [Brienomyrus brachyistius]|uniref:GRIP and coiled-coil domain-containing protein 2 isoform X2 n=1 Tax=Brienomyrus brachyistius TaxID=42636 RepID=UPI0020B380F3|nr:GRIP and coiled-coil domain-containing protein 2 isoform X2 [Brienomyrus brachyistius]